MNADEKAQGYMLGRECRNTISGHWQLTKAIFAIAVYVFCSNVQAQSQSQIASTWAEILRQQDGWTDEYTATFARGMVLEMCTSEVMKSPNIGSVVPDLDGAGYCTCAAQHGPKTMSRATFIRLFDAPTLAKAINVFGPTVGNVCLKAALEGNNSTETKKGPPGRPGRDLPAASFERGEMLYAKLTGTDRSGDYWSARGYVIGIVDADVVTANCTANAHANGEQVIDIVRGYLVAHPEDRNLQPARIVRYAVLSAFGCDIPK